MDHIGSLPALIDGGYDGPIYATQPTLAITRLSLEDALSLQRVSPGETKKFIDRFDRLARSVTYDASTVLVGSTSLALREAGHLLGSASAEITSAKSRVILSGDLGRTNSPILRDPNRIWTNQAPVNLVVMECTYGSRDHGHSADEIRNELERIVIDGIRRGGHILVPAFALGRTQTLLWYLNDLVESKRITSIPVFIDTPMGLAATKTYSSFSALFDKEALARIDSGDDPLDFTNLFSVERGRDSRDLVDARGPLIIIAGSGMCNGGRIVGHLSNKLSDPTSTVLFVGHQADGTLGQNISEAASRRRSSVRINGDDVPLLAKIEVLHGLSAHADRSELASWLRAIPSIESVALHHGDRHSQQAFSTFVHA